MVNVMNRNRALRRFMFAADAIIHVCGAFDVLKGEEEKPRDNNTHEYILCVTCLERQVQITSRKI